MDTMGGKVSAPKAHAAVSSRRGEIFAEKGWGCEGKSAGWGDAEHLKELAGFGY